MDLKTEPINISNYTKNTAEVYSVYRKPVGLDIILDNIQKLDKTASEIKILDLGCGVGNYSMELFNRGYKVTAADYNQSMLDVLKTKIAEKCDDNRTIETFTIDLKNLPDSDSDSDKYSGYDVVIINQVIHHLNDFSQDFCHLNNVFRFVSNILQENGLFILNTSDLNQHLYGMWWGKWFTNEITEYCKRYCAFNQIKEIAVNNGFNANIKQITCTQPFIGESYYNPRTVFDDKILDSDTMWQYIGKEKYDVFIEAIKDEDIEVVFKDANQIEKYGQSTTFVFNLHKQ